MLYVVRKIEHIFFVLFLSRFSEAKVDTIVELTLVEFTFVPFSIFVLCKNAMTQPKIKGKLIHGELNVQIYASDSETPPAKFFSEDNLKCEEYRKDCNVQDLILSHVVPFYTFFKLFSSFSVFQINFNRNLLAVKF